MAFDGIKTNRINKYIGLSGPVASGERGQIYDADPDALLPRLEAAEAEIKLLRTKIGALGRESARSAISSGIKTSKPTNLRIISQNLIQDIEGHNRVEVAIEWSGYAPEWEIAIGRKQ